MTAQTKEDIYAELDRKVQENLTLRGNCAQTTFLMLQEQFDLEGGAILKALTLDGAGFDPRA
jgi:hypothetical protein